MISSGFVSVIFPTSGSKGSFDHILTTFVINNQNQISYQEHKAEINYFPALYTLTLCNIMLMLLYGKNKENANWTAGAKDPD